MKIVSTRYVLAVQDLQKSVAFYTQKLGFITDWKAHGWHALRLGQCQLMLGECADEVPAFQTGNHSYFAYLEIEEIDSFYAELIAKQVEIVAAISDQPWGMREFGICTLDGHRIMFGQQINNL